MNNPRISADWSATKPIAPFTGKKIKFPEENYNRTSKGHIFDEFPVSELYRTSHISLQIFFCAGQYCMSFTLLASGESIFSCSYCVMQELTM